MNAPVQEAAQALVPLLSVGVDAALEELAKDAGSRISRTASRIIEAIRGSLGGPAPHGRDQIEQALQVGLTNGSFEGSDLQILASSVQIGGDNVAGNVYRDSVFNFEVKQGNVNL